MRRSAIPVILIAMVTVASMMPASAAVQEEFFTGGNASAGWATFSPAPPGAAENASIQFFLYAEDGSDYDEFAVVRYTGVPTAAPATPPSFMFRSTVSNAGSGGSPRLVIVFGTGSTVTGTMQLRPLLWTADTWVKVDGAVVDSSQGWDVTGGTCGFLYQATYSTGLACHTGADVLRVSIADDSGWFHPGGYTHYIDDISYGDTRISYPPACRDDFTGSHENGTLSAPIHDVVEPVVDGPALLAGAVHGVNCDHVVPAGL